MQKKLELPTNTFVVTQSFMINELNLSGKKLQIYSIIYGFSQGGQGCFEGSYSYIASWIGCSVITVKRLVKEMRMQGFLEMKEKGKSCQKKNKIIAKKPPKN